jgi:hypothetical protein
VLAGCACQWCGGTRARRHLSVQVAVQPQRDLALVVALVLWVHLEQHAVLRHGLGYRNGAS